MHILEKYIMGKYGKEELCEDAIVVTEDFAAVIDGVSSKSSITYEGKSSGRIAAEILVEGVKLLKKDMTFIEAVNFLNSRMRLWCREQGQEERLTENPDERPSASIAIYSKSMHQLWLVGDCQALYKGIIVSNRLKLDEFTSGIRCQVIEFLMSIGFTEAELLQDDISLKCVTPLLNIQPFIQNGLFNSPYDYPVLDGFELREDLIKIVQLPEDAKEIVLATDGYPRLLPNLDDTEEYLKYILEEDPLCYKIFKNVKGKYNSNISFDDRAYIRFER